MNEEVSTPSPVKVATNPMPHISTNIPPAATITPMKQRSRGISLNIAVSPASPLIGNNSFGNHSSTPSKSNSTINGNNSTANGTHLSHHRRNSLANTLPQLPESPWEELKYDLPLPETDSLMSMDIDEQLRLLALKEMSVVEIKDHIGTLQNKLKKHEDELHRLREVIQRTLYKEMGSSTHTSNNVTNSNGNHNNSNGSGNGNSNGNINPTTEPRDAAVRSTKRRSRTLSLTGSSISEEEDPSNQPISRSNSIQTPSKKSNNPIRQPASKADRSSSIWSNLSKPLNLIQQFDTMLQNEFEKSLIPQEHHYANQQQLTKLGNNQDLNTDGVSARSVRTSEDSNSSGLTAVSSPLKDKMPTNLLHVGTSYEEKIQTVSLSIWSFVSDVRTNVMSSLADEGSEMVYNIDTGSTISLNDQNTEASEVDNLEERIDKIPVERKLSKRKLKTN